MFPSTVIYGVGIKMILLIIRLSQFCTSGDGKISCLKWKAKQKKGKIVVENFMILICILLKFNLKTWNTWFYNNLYTICNLTFTMSQFYIFNNLSIKNVVVIT